MNIARREFLATAACGAAAMSVVPWCAFARNERFRRVRPSDAGWPQPAAWQELNDQVGGRLLVPRPLIAPCITDPASTACRDIVENIRNPFYIGDQAGGTQVSGWLNAWTPTPSAYAVAARSAEDIAAAVRFANKYRLRLAVKGAGHSYLGTSCAPDSLLVWTRHMRNVALHDEFVPQGCEGAEPTPAVTVDAGALWIDLYDAVTTRAGRYVQGGGCTDVGVAGLVLSGGFGSFSKGFGTAASHLLEAEIVTADGQIRTVNAKNHPGLFWALKGGGGGSWGVVTRVTLRTHDLPNHFGSVVGRIRARSDDAFRKLIREFLEFYRQRLLNPHWGEQASFSTDNVLTISMVCQGLTRKEATATWQPFLERVRALATDVEMLSPVKVSVGRSRDWWAVRGNPAMNKDRRPGAPAHHGWWKGDQDQVGAYIHGYDSVWLDANLLRPGSALANAIFAASRHKRLQLHFNKGLAGAPSDVIDLTLKTATNPAVVRSFALAIVADGQGPRYAGMPGDGIRLQLAQEDASAIARAMEPMREVARDGGSYVSESNFFNANWQADYWGAHAKLLATIKQDVDPDGLFIVHNGVGSEFWSPDGFERLEGSSTVG